MGSSSSWLCLFILEIFIVSVLCVIHGVGGAQKCLPSSRDQIFLYEKFDHNVGEAGLRFGGKWVVGITTLRAQAWMKKWKRQHGICLKILVSKMQTIISTFHTVSSLLAPLLCLMSPPFFPSRLYAAWGSRVSFTFNMWHILCRALLMVGIQPMWVNGWKTGDCARVGVNL